MAFLRPWIVLVWLYITTSVAQRPQDPIKNFCRRYGHQTAVIDRKLYIDGGWLYANPISQNPIATINRGLIFSDLDHTDQGMPVQHANLTKNSSVPDVAGGVLWADEVNKVFWLYGGEFADAADPFQLWGYDVLLNQWNTSSAGSTDGTYIQRLSYGAGVAISSLGKAFYYGGYLNSKTNPSWQGPALAMNNLLTFDMDENTLTNGTGPPDSIPRAEGVMVSIPASQYGLLVYFGGSIFPYGNSTAVPMTLDTILLYDIGDAKWVTQKATGQIPPNRRKFCAGATWAQDQSSYNIYLYGGFGYGSDTNGWDDVYILSMPTFTWIKWYPDQSGTPYPHGDLSCNVIDNSQMIVMGGNFTSPKDDQLCDATIVGGQHNLNLGQQDVSGAKWYQYLPNLTSYSVPAAIISAVGGSASGLATNIAPSTGFNDSALSVYFNQKAAYSSRTPTRVVPMQTASTSATPPPPSKKLPFGAIVGGVVGGLAVILLALLAIFCCLRRRKRARFNQRPPYGPTQGISEVSGASRYEEKNAVTSIATHSNASHPTSPYSTPPPVQPGVYDSDAPYRHPAHAMSQQPYYPTPTQQTNNFGFQHYPMSTTSQVPGMQYYPPPEIRQSPPMTYPMPMEMPTAISPGIGVYHVVHQPMPVRKQIGKMGNDGDKDGSSGL